MKLIFKGSNEEIKMLLGDIFTGGEEESLNARDAKLEKELQKEYDDYVTDIENYVHYSESKKEFIKVSEMNFFHKLNLLSKVLNNSTDLEKMTDTLVFQSLILNIHNDTVEKIILQKLENGSVGNCFKDSMNNNKNEEANDNLTE